MSSVTHLAIEPWGLVLVGFVAGLFGSLLGLGGGWLMVPALTAAGLGVVASVGSSLAAMVVTTSVSTFKYYRQGRLQLRLGLACGIPAAFGVQIGKMSLETLARLGVADFAVGAFYVGLLLVLGISMLKRKRDVASTTPSPQREARLYQVSVVGLVAGTLSGVLGIGGGVVLVPVLTGVFGIPVLTAVATSLVSVLVSASYGSVSFALAGDWEPVASAWLALGAVFGGLLGTTLAPHAPERVLRHMFAALTIVTALSIVARLVGHTDLSLTMLFGGAGVLGTASLIVLIRAYVAGRATGKAGAP